MDYFEVGVFRFKNQHRLQLLLWLKGFRCIQLITILSYLDLHSFLTIFDSLFNNYKTEKRSHS